MRRLTALLVMCFAVTAGVLGSASPAHAETTGHLLRATGAQEKHPAQADPDGSALAVFNYDTVAGRFCYRVKAESITVPVTAMAIESNNDGKTVLELDPAKVDGTSECLEIGVPLVEQILFHPEDYVLNLRTSDHPQGAVAAKLSHEDADTTAIEAAGNGASVVPGPGDGEGTLTADLEIGLGDADFGQLCGMVKASGVDLPAIALEVHRGAPGQVGEVVADLDETKVNGPSIDCTAVDSEPFIELHEHPERFYLSLATRGFPNGAVRAQFARADGPPVATPAPAPAPAPTTSTPAALPKQVNSGDGGQAATRPVHRVPVAVEAGSDKAEAAGPGSSRALGVVLLLAGGAGIAGLSALGLKRRLR